MLVDGTSLGGKSFVDFQQIQVLRFPAGAGQGFLRGGHRAHAHHGRVQAAGGEAGDAAQGRQAQCGGFLCRHHHHRRCAVVDARSIAGGHATSLIKRGAQTGQRFGIGFAVDKFISGKNDGVAFFLGDAKGHDFIDKLACVLRGSGFLLAGQRQCVLHIAADAVGLGHVLGGDAHVVLVVHIPQAIDDHRVHHVPVTHALAVAAAHQHMGRSAHVFLATGDDDLAVAPGHGLRGQHHGFETGAAHGVDGEGRGFFG